MYSARLRISISPRIKEGVITLDLYAVYGDHYSEYVGSTVLPVEEAVNLLDDLVGRRRVIINFFDLRGRVISVTLEGREKEEFGRKLREALNLLGVLVFKKEDAIALSELFGLISRPQSLVYDEGRASNEPT